MSDEGTPGNISNPVVKLISADGTWRATSWESRSLPRDFSYLIDLFMGTYKRKKPLGNDLLSQEVALQVPSALTALTTGFEMLPGVPLSLQSPRDLIHLLSLPKINRIVCSPQKSAEFPAPHEEALDH